jgi:hypothetical protein
MEKVVTTRYIITQGSQFLIGFYRNEAYWSSVPHDAVQTGHAYLNHGNAIAKLKEARSALGRDDLSLTLVTLAKQGLRWDVLSQQGVTA